MTATYDPRADWDRDDHRAETIASLAASYASSVDVYHAEVRALNARHQAELREAQRSFEARNAQVTAELRRLVAERRVDAQLASYARRLRGE